MFGQDIPASGVEGRGAFFVGEVFWRFDMCEMSDGGCNVRGRFCGLEDWNAETLRDSGVGEEGGREPGEIFGGICGRMRCRVGCMLRRLSKTEISDNTALT